MEQFRGIASFVDPHTIRVTIPDGGAQELGADVVLLARARARSTRRSTRSTTSTSTTRTSILLLDRMPRSLAVLGGGVAGCEYASLFAALNVNVKLVDSKDRLLTWLDAELSGAMQDVFKSSGIDLHQRTRAAKLEPGEKDVRHAGGRRAHRRPEGARRLGRIGNVEGLNLSAAGLAATERGLLKVNAQFQTAVPHIYAAGDVIGFLARVGVDGAGARRDEPRVRRHPEPARLEHPADGHLHHPRGLVGRRHRGDAQEQGHPYVVGRASLEGNGRANLIGEAVGFREAHRRRGERPDPRRALHRPTRLRARPHRRAVMAHQGDLQYFIEAVFNYPTLGEVYKYAAYDALDQMRERREERLPFTRPAASVQGGPGLRSCSC